MSTKPRSRKSARRHAAHKAKHLKARLRNAGGYKVKKPGARMKKVHSAKAHLS